MSALLAAIVAAGITIPHALRLQRVHPLTAIVLWLSALALRALTGVLAVILLLFFLPRTEAFAALTHWCLELGLPLANVTLDVEGHGIADLALYLPGVGLSASVLFACRRTARSARQARHLVEHEVVGNGPEGTLIVSGREVLFAVAGLVHPRIVVSAGALTWLDDDELEAALDHERAHIVHRHRFVMLAGIALAALGRVLPGTRAALGELVFQLERDADRWALEHRSDRLALASVICKAATAEPPASPIIVALGSNGVRERLSQLLSEPEQPHRRSLTTALNALATAMVMCTLLLAAIVPTAAVAGVADDPHRTHHVSHCHH